MYCFTNRSMTESSLFPSLSLSLSYLPFFLYFSPQKVCLPFDTWGRSPVISFKCFILWLAFGNPLAVLPAGAKLVTKSRADTLHPQSKESLNWSHGPQSADTSFVCVSAQKLLKCMFIRENKMSFLDFFSYQHFQQSLSPCLQQLQIMRVSCLL